jgi:hypothetical protein
MESELTHYGNGPLPDDLKAAAYFTEDRKEWALPKADALAYLDWCERENLSVLGFEVWYPTMPGPTVVEHGIGNVEGIAATRDGIRRHPDRDAHDRFVFNICVGENGSTSTAS